MSVEQPSTALGLSARDRVRPTMTPQGQPPRLLMLLPLPWSLAMAVLAARVDTWSSATNPWQWAVLLVALALGTAAGRPEQAWRPVARSTRLAALARRYRNTIWGAVFILAVAVTRPPAWGAALDAVVLCGYLVSLDVVTAGEPIRTRVGRPAFALSVAVLSAGTAAIVAVPSPHVSWPRLLAAVTTGLVVLVVLIPLRLWQIEDARRDASDHETPAGVRPYQR
jgi:hypothetical protein